MRRLLTLLALVLVALTASFGWNGVLPTVTSGATPFIQVPSSK